jgi:nitrite reductase/ring-hydroxylating ferredoxin subunit
MLFGKHRPEWTKVAEYESDLLFGVNDIAVCEARGKRFCIGRWQGKYFAFAFKCPHAGGILSDGFIDAMGNIVCPLHRYKYSMSNGRNISGEGYYLKHWAVEVREDGVYVEL